MRYVFYALACMTAVWVWAHNTEQGRSAQRQFSEPPVDARWSH